MHTTPTVSLSNGMPFAVGKQPGGGDGGGSMFYSVADVSTKTKENHGTQQRCGHVLQRQYWRNLSSFDSDLGYYLTAL